ncbi:MAG: SAM-dependent methyltransferase [Zetaproteobacteria bacterium]|nr:MAG: SAM-dependent methyltransferase [Zetaproteobacteria bacterium]
MLEDLIRREIEAHDGWVPFERFMELALYAPGLGYYERERVFGADGDFITAAEMGSWLAGGLVDLVKWSLDQLGKPRQWILMEQGGGSGMTLVRLVLLLEQMGVSPPERVIEIERSAWLRRQQQELFKKHGLSVEQHADQTGLNGLENVVFFSNELPDAFPVRCFKWEHEVLWERGVTCTDSGFAWHEIPLASGGPDIPRHLKSDWPDGYVSEWNPNLDPWQETLANMIERGIMITVDYGYRCQEYYRPGRATGTLIAHHRHRVEEDVLAAPGTKDITAHVDFTALARSGLRHGIHPLLWTTQGAWLAHSPTVQTLVHALADERSTNSMSMLAYAKRLMLPSGMGELFKLLIQGTHAWSVPPYLSSVNRLGRLGLDSTS